MMIEKIIYDFLSEKLAQDNISVYMEIPKERPSNFVLIEKTSGRKDGIYQSTFAIKSYGASLFEAASLNDKVIDYMDGFIRLDEISRVELNSNYNFTDTETKQHRYQAVFDIWHY